MKKLLLVAFAITTIAACKKEGSNNPNKITHTASDSVYLVSNVIEKNFNLDGSETFTYDDQHHIIKDVVVNNLNNTTIFYTFTYNTDGTIASMTYNNGNAEKFDFSYQNGIPTSFYPDDNPSAKEIYTLTDNVTRINYPLGPAVGYTHYMTYTYDTNNNIISTVYVNKSPNESNQFVDSTRTFYQYNSHKSAFYYSNINFVLDPSFTFLPQPGKNMAFGRVKIDFEANGDFPTLNSDSITYNKADLPVKVTRYINNSNSPTVGEIYTYLEVKK
jgi:hypothetical protein